MVAGEGLEPTVLHFLCGENAAVGSAALTAHRAVIHYRLTLRVMSGSRCVHPGVSGASLPFLLGTSFRLAVLYPLSPPQFFLLWVRIWVKRKTLCGDGEFIQRMRRDVLPISSLHGVPGNTDGFEKALVRELPIPGAVDIRLYIEQAPFVVTENDQENMIRKRCDRYGFYS